MSIGDWFNQLGGNIRKGAEWLGQTVSKGADWLHEKVVKPIGDIGSPVAHKLGFGGAWDAGRGAIGAVNNLQKKLLQTRNATAADWGDTVGKVGRAGGEILRHMPGVGGAIGNFARKHL